MPAAMSDDHRMIGRCGVQILPRKLASFSSLGVIVFETADPLAFRRVGGALADGFLDVRNGAEIAVHRSQMVHPENRDMCVRIDETRQYRLACKIGLLGV